MKSWIRLSVLRRCSFILAGAIPLAAWSQGPLLPAGAPAPTMKTLDQVEPRIPISSLPFSINQPGSYYLTANLAGTSGANGITILANDVTLDLEGFALIGSSGSLAGIHAPSSQNNLEIRNGVVRAWGQQGIDAGLAGSSRLVGLRVSGNGGNGIEGNGCTVKDCVVTQNEGVGIVVGTASIVSGCRLIENELGGIQVDERSVIQGNACSDNFDFGIQATGVDNRIVDNHVATHTIGLDLDAADNYVAGNTVVDNLKNYDCVPGNQLNLLLSEIPESIDWPASVKLAGTLTGRTGQDGITINADDVTIDFNGHSLVGVPGSLSGIHIPTSIGNIEIRNGTVRAWGHYGINAALAGNCRFLNLQAVANGFGTPFTYGLQAGPRSMIRGCTASGNGSFGIAGGTASIIENCVSVTNGVTGIRAFSCTVTDCSASDNLGPGIHADASTVTDCTVQGNAGGGIRVSDNSTLKGNRCIANGGSFGIWATSSGNRIENNHVLDQAIGLDVDAGGNDVADNIVRGNTDNYDIDPGNQLNLLLCEIPESIDWPASVKLISTLTGILDGSGIFITSDDVTIDLDGHALEGRSTGSTIFGIFCSADIVNIEVRNGILRSWRNGGIALRSANRCRVINVTAIGNGLSSPASPGGIRVGDDSVIKNCVAGPNSGSGILAGLNSVIEGCTASKSTFGTGISASSSCTIRHCIANGNAKIGIAAGAGSQVTDCSAQENGDEGIFAGDRCVISRCSATANSGDGIRAGSECRIVHNSCVGNGALTGSGAGIRVTGPDNRIEGNTVNSNDRGLDVDVVGNLIIRNSASGNDFDYSEVVGGNTMGEVVDTSAAGGTLDENDSPWANFSF